MLKAILKRLESGEKKSVNVPRLRIVRPNQSA